MNRKITSVLLSLLFVLSTAVSAFAYDPQPSSTTPYQGVRISNGSGDEIYASWGGQAGDQTGAEWRIVPWYSRPWSCVLRYPDKRVANLLADLTEEAALNDNIGYNYMKRTTFWEQLSKVGYHPKNITVPCDADCSAGVAACTKAVGYLLGIKPLQDLDPDLHTRDQTEKMQAAGFQVLRDPDLLHHTQNLQRGDVLLLPWHHTATVLDDGSKFAPTTGGDSPLFEGRVYQDNVTVRTGPGDNYPELAAWPRVQRGTYVDVFDIMKGENNHYWYKVRIAGNTFGYLPMARVQDAYNDEHPKLNY